MNAEELLALIDPVLKNQGWSDRKISMMVCGRPYFIKHIRRGHMPSHKNLMLLFEHLGIDPVTLEPKDASPNTLEQFIQTLPHETREQLRLFLAMSNEERGMVRLAAALPPDKRRNLEAIMSALVDADRPTRVNDKAG